MLQATESEFVDPTDGDKKFHKKLNYLFFYTFTQKKKSMKKWGMFLYIKLILLTEFSESSVYYRSLDVPHIYFWSHLGTLIWLRSHLWNHVITAKHLSKTPNCFFPLVNSEGHSNHHEFFFLQNFTVFCSFSGLVFPWFLDQYINR